LQVSRPSSFSASENGFFPRFKNPEIVTEINKTLRAQNISEFKASRLCEPSCGAEWKGGGVGSPHPA
ncbi:MAG TPA: hypothetical protein VM681_05645, partial [Candidatus Thermoplasmatota archaeon]|nr:hypothetical protein [Candidatus Thermoplasmatota archaeon]